MSSPLQGKKLLVADDDPPILRIVEMVLSRQGVDVLTAADGEQAFHLAVTEKPDAILLDVRMPGMNGLELCAKLRATESTAAIPVGFLTAEKDLDTYKLAQELGSALFITKPFKPERLVDTIGILLTARPPKTEDTL